MNKELEKLITELDCLEENKQHFSVVELRYHCTDIINRTSKLINVPVELILNKEVLI